MAVYDHAYRGYGGPRATAWARRLVVPRYAFAQLLESRLFVLLLAACAAYPLGCAGYIYIRHNADLLLRLGVREELLALGPRFFLIFLQVQGLSLGLLLTLFAGPPLVASDLRNNALPLYFSRPLSRWEYAAGKFAVLATLLSAVTWVPGLLLWVLEAALAGGSWWRENLWLAGSLLAGSWLLIVVLGLIALAASALVKWRTLAAAVIFGVFSAGTPFGLALNETLNIRWGGVFAVARMIGRTWSALYGNVSISPEPDPAPTAAAVASLVVVCIAALAVLARKLRAYEVVR